MIVGVWYLPAASSGLSGIGCESPMQACFQVEEAGDAAAHRDVVGDVDRLGESAAHVEGVGEGIDERGVVTALDLIGSCVRGLVVSHSCSPPLRVQPTQRCPGVAERGTHRGRVHAKLRCDFRWCRSVVGPGQELALLAT